MLEGYDTFERRRTCKRIPPHSLPFSGLHNFVFRKNSSSFSHIFPQYNPARIYHPGDALWLVRYEPYLIHQWIIPHHSPHCEQHWACSVSVHKTISCVYLLSRVASKTDVDDVKEMATNGEYGGCVTCCHRVMNSNNVAVKFNIPHIVIDILLHIFIQRPH